jgi:cyclopropane-fatty-acyl-phospholipid synthase
MTSKDKVQQLLTKADITINGTRPWDIQVHNEGLYDRVLREGTLALGESYVDGWWDVPDLSEFFAKALRSKIADQVSPIGMMWYIVRAHLTNMQNKERAFQVGREHYDIGNDIYERMLDKRLVYTCAYWKDAETLDEAQEAKLDLVCRKLGIKPGDKVLDVGCGWGSFMQFAAEKYGAHVTGITVSEEQAALVREKLKHLPIEIRVEDYRDTTGEFDHIVSLGMFEHVGPKNYRTYIEKMRSLLKDDGLFMLHTIGSGASTMTNDPWIDKYIFPNGVLPSIEQIGTAINDIMIVEDLHNFGAYYDITLMHWWANFDKRWPEIAEKYGPRFWRMWRYYLMSCAGAFRARHTQLWQIVLSKNGVVGGYTSVR